MSDNKTKNKSGAALILGMVSIPAAVLPLLGLPAAGTGLAFSIIGLMKKNRFASAGLICSAAGLVLTCVSAGFGYFITIKTGLPF